MQSSFISFGWPDLAIATRIRDALESRGLTTFFFPRDAEPGQKLHRMMRLGINHHDRVILICSRASLNRSGVLNEIEETLAREARDGGAEYLIPIRVDNYVFEEWSPTRSDIAQAVRDRVVADFTDPARFDDSLSRLVAVLGKPRNEDANPGTLPRP